MKVHYSRKFVMFVPDTVYDMVKVRAFAKENNKGLHFNDRGQGLYFRIPDEAELCLKALTAIFGEQLGKNLADRIGVLHLAEFIIRASSQVN